MQNSNHPKLFVFFLGTLCVLIGAATSFLIQQNTATAVRPKFAERIQRFHDTNLQDPSSSFDDDNNENGSSFDIEQIRQKLEALVSQRGDPEDPQEPSPAPPSPQPSPSKDPFTRWLQGLEPPSSAALTAEIVVPEPPPLTMIGRKLRVMEVKLLQDLAKDDQAIPVLWELWFHERGSAAAARLKQAETLSTQPETWQQAEEILLELIETHSVHWAEPVNRLATLYFIQGRFEESERMCKTVLKVKPWHFGALSGIVLVYAKMDSIEKARQWAALRLPGLSPLGPTPRRNEWVKRSTKQANAALRNAGKQLKYRFGPQDDRTKLHQPPIIDASVDTDSWQ